MKRGPTKDHKVESMTKRHTEVPTSTQNLDTELIPMSTKEQGHLMGTEGCNAIDSRCYSSNDGANTQTAYPIDIDQCSNGNMTFKTQSPQCNTNDSNKKPTKYVCKSKIADIRLQRIVARLREERTICSKCRGSKNGSMRALLMPLHLSMITWHI